MNNKLGLVCVVQRTGITGLALSKKLDALLAYPAITATTGTGEFDACVLDVSLAPRAKCRPGLARCRATW